MKRNAVIIAAALALTACASTPPAPVPQSGRLGVMFLTAPHPTHIYFGLTIFNEKTQELASNWDIESEALAEITKLTSGKFEVVKVEPTEQLRQTDNWITTSGDAVDEKYAADLIQIRDTHKLDLLLVLKPVELDIVPPIGPVPGISPKTKGYGIFTRCLTELLCRSMVFNFVGIRPYLLSPPAATYSFGGHEQRRPIEVEIKAPGVVRPEDDAVARQTFLEMLRSSLATSMDRTLNGPPKVRHRRPNKNAKPSSNP